MTNEELQKLISQLDEPGLKDNASFGIYQYAGSSAETYVKANREGLILFAAQFLKAAKDAENGTSDKPEKIISLDFNESWMDERGEMVIQYVEPVVEETKQQGIRNDKNKPTAKSTPVGCFGVIAVFFDRFSNRNFYPCEMDLLIFALIEAALAQSPAYSFLK